MIFAPYDNSPIEVMLREQHRQLCDVMGQPSLARTYKITKTRKSDPGLAAPFAIETIAAIR